MRIAFTKHALKRSKERRKISYEQTKEIATKEIEEFFERNPGSLLFEDEIQIPSGLYEWVVRIDEDGCCVLVTILDRKFKKK